MKSIYNLQSTIYNRRKAFTLVELMIVVAILGILAAIVLPEFQSQSQVAKEAAAKANIKILRDAIERYALDHNGVPPGYPSNNPLIEPTQKILTTFFTQNKLYFSAPPKNPFNNSSYIILIGNNVEFPPSATDLSGWIYKPSTKTIRLNTSGKDGNNILYFEY